MPAFTPVKRPEVMVIPNVATYEPFIQTIGVDASNAVAIATGMFIEREADLNATLAVTGSILGYVTKVYKPDGSAFVNGYIPASTAGVCEYIPVNIPGLQFAICEDAVGGNITDGTHLYVDLIQTVTVNNSNAKDQGIIGSVLLDSSTASASAGTLLMELRGLYGGVANVRPSGNTTAPLTHRCTPRAAIIQVP